MCGISGGFVLIQDGGEHSHKNIEAETDTTYNVFCKGVLYFGWPKQPSSGTGMGEFYIGCVLCSILPEIRKTI